MIEKEEAGGIIEIFALNKGAKGFEVVALDSLCGGKVTISMEVVSPMPHILLFGGGHVANQDGGRLHIDLGSHGIRLQIGWVSCKYVANGKL